MAVSAPRNRFLIVTAYRSAPIAAAEFAAYPATVVPTGRQDYPYLAFRIVYADMVNQEPVPFQWHEFRAPTQSDPYCQKNAFRPALTTPATCAAYYLDRWPHAGMVTTAEQSVVVWY